jgi:hypothetical protein
MEFAFHFGPKGIDLRNQIRKLVADAKKNIVLLGESTLRPASNDDHK